jgi:hypothetical protein
MSSNSNNGQRFNEFPRLLTELRRQVFRTALHHQQQQHQSIVELNVSYDRVTSLSSPHPILHVTHESREEAKRVLTKLSFYPTDRFKQRYAFVDLEKDLIYLKLGERLTPTMIVNLVFD